jgi:predicted phage terminase large subunit-like protein
MMDLAADLATALDPVRLAHQAGLEPDGWQAAVLRSASPRLLLNCCRQSGKSTITALVALHTAVYVPGSLVLLLSPSLRQSAELFKKALGVYRTIERPVAAAAESALRLELTNGSRLISLPGREGGAIRGYSGVALLVIDEAAWVSDELYTAVRPMLAVSGGRLVALSTPNGRQGWWYEAWAQGGADWQRVEVPATQCPRISAAFLDEELRVLGPSTFSQEYECRFISRETQLFDPTTWPTWDTLPEGCATYQAWDLAISEKASADYTVGVTIAIDSAKRIYLVDVRRGRWDFNETQTEIAAFGEQYDPAAVGIEQVSYQAAAVQEALRRTWLPIRPLRISRTGTPGRQTLGGDKLTRARILEARASAGTVYRPRQAVWWPSLAQELAAFPQGRHDDGVDALVYAVHLAAEATSQDDVAYALGLTDCGACGEYFHEAPAGAPRPCPYCTGQLRRWRPAPALATDGPR